MRVAFVVNEATGLQPDQTTARLAQVVVGLGHDLVVASVDGLALDGGTGLLVVGRSLSGPASSPSELVERVRAAPQGPVALEPGDAVLVRTNPGRDARGALHLSALDILAVAVERGVRVVNEPRGLARAGTKAYLLLVSPPWRPETVVARDPGVLLDFARSCAGPAVVKPLRGTQGRDVFLLRPDDHANQRQILEVVTREGYAMAQPYLRAAPDGDVRLLVLDGEPVLAGAGWAAVRRVPASGAFRSNVAAGGRAVATTPSPAMLAAAREIGPRAAAHGLRFVGLDFVGEQVVELNTFSPGGLTDIERFAGADVATEVTRRLLEGPR